MTRSAKKNGAVDPDCTTGALGPNELAHPLSVAGVQGRLIQLRPQQRLAHSMISGGSLLAVHDGVLAIDAMSSKSERQILDFLMPGDIVFEAACLSPHKVSLRAITIASLTHAVGAEMSHTELSAAVLAVSLRASRGAACSSQHPPTDHRAPRCGSSRGVLPLGTHLAQQWLFAIRNAAVTSNVPRRHRRLCGS